MGSYYYLVGLGIPRHWNEAMFTYSSLTQLPIGSLVQVSFGNKQTLTGFVVKKAAKPTFKTKDISHVYNLTLHTKTLTFIDWYRQFYQAPLGQVLQQFIPQYLTKKSPDLSEIKHLDTYSSVELSKKQKHTVNDILSDSKTIMLHGVTGAGKTRIYAELLYKQIASGKDALLLYPEIGLTTQLYKDLSKHLPVLYFHSQLTTSERNKLWRQYASSDRKAVVVIGTRSALFLPHKNLGLVIIDEVHEASFKQQNDIRYNSLLVAGGLAKIHNAKLVAASATPPITETKLMIQSNGRLVCLHEQAIKSSHEKNAKVIDLNNKQLFKKHPLLSDALINAIASNLKTKKQSLIFINRRGTAKIQLCENCDWQSKCPNCDLPLTYHHDSYTMLCHTCGHKEKPTSTCIKCGKNTIFKAFGSKAFVTELETLFPQAKIARFDSDNDKKQSLANRYEAIRDGNIDIIIGTQQIIKGLDLPYLKTVGIVSADLSLHFPDYTSEERTFQLINQATGRVGRGHGVSEVFVQTYAPHAIVINEALHNDWHSLYERELKNRKQHSFPPFSFAAKVNFRAKTYQAAFKNAQKFISDVNNSNHKNSIELLGPISAFHAKENKNFNINVIIKSTKRSTLLNISAMTPKNNAIFDFDPNNFL